MDKIRDCWCTPLSLFNELNKEFNFTVDACATLDNSLCPKYYNDCLIETWKNETVFLNPPYSNPRRFVEKAFYESKECLVVALLKCDTSTKLWGVIYDYEKQEYREGIKVRFFPKRVRFSPPKNVKESSPNFSSCVIIMDRKLTKDG